MLAREKYLEASFFYDQASKHTDEGEPLKYYLSAFLHAFRSVTFYLQAEFACDPRFGPWYAAKQDEMRQDPAFRVLDEQRRLVVHQRNPRVTGKFTVYVRHEGMAMSEAVKALTWAPDGSEVTVLSPPDLPPDFAGSGNLAKVERQFFFEGYEERDLFGLGLEGLYKLDKLIGEWEEARKAQPQQPSGSSA